MSTYWNAMKTTMKKVYLTWEDFNEYIEWLSDSIVITEAWSDSLYKGVYGVPRGGLPTAVALSNRLNIPLLMAPDDNIIIVDDIWDSGQTLLPLYERYVVSGNCVMFVWLLNVERSEKDVSKKHLAADGFEYYKESYNKWYYFPWEY